MTTKHTPGPWSFKTVSTDGASSVKGADGRGVASVSGNIRRPADEMVANAALIAAAPELLEALKRTVSALRGGYAPQIPDDDVRRYCPAYGEALDVIYKAEGR